MTKGDLIDAVAKSAKLSKRAAEDAVDATFEGIENADLDMSIGNVDPQTGQVVTTAKLSLAAHLSRGSSFSNDSAALAVRMRSQTSPSTITEATRAI